MNALALGILEDLAALLEAGSDVRYACAICRDDHNEVVGTHFAPLRLALAFLDTMRVVDLASETAGGSVPVELASIAHVNVVIY